MEEGFNTLYVKGLRQVRARYPNGDPLVPKSGYMKGGSHSGTWHPKNEEIPTNTKIVSKTGTVISQGPSEKGGTVTVEDTDIPRTLGNCKQKQSMYKNTRFNETYNFPYWATDSISGVEQISDTGFRSKHWAHLTNSTNPAVVKMYVYISYLTPYLISYLISYLTPYLTPYLIPYVACPGTSPPVGGAGPSRSRAWTTPLVP